MQHTEDIKGVFFGDAGGEAADELELVVARMEVLDGLEV